MIAVTVHSGNKRFIIIEYEVLHITDILEYGEARSVCNIHEPRQFVTLIVIHTAEMTAEDGKSCTHWEMLRFGNLDFFRRYRYVMCFIIMASAHYVSLLATTGYSCRNNNKCNNENSNTCEEEGS